ncbi:hypothetical protein EG888_04110 [Listeria monocytogenes]|jgi:hypothetical protein|uniref:Lmo0080 protein n=3 Tax=Listeria monocytogenes TaxID=1639 RepID=Q8YAN7_LISMO|nr:hypothetical protein [Listeria monocytogenes]NP_463613.1 hypothetical protein lmo0080 [Listeria monocytogenes EGD-e]EAA0165359.1 hypothetical protein [Listeria monocytogenes serotype 1/2a]EAE3703019.1 hypothetical protein [Listeria monocytogenes serotype 1/2c]EAF4502354.1 hypothetical protein [Listeria monocytogenes serotype 4b]EAG6362635.1 hypothetical protein [Listeria monocytogenes CFSAN002351]AEO24382.1 conserved hypothetical protein [Listeria monocytogenes FSL R2-561]
MSKTTQMNSEIFQINLEKTLKEIMVAKGLQSDEIRFVIVPVEEKGKMLDGSDEMMKRLVLTKENIGNKQLVLKDVVDVLGGLFPKAPIWINVSFLEMNGEKAIFKLETSLRFRKPTLLRNAETGHAPFKAIT